MTQPISSSPVIWVAIPCYNNAATIFDIAQRTLQQLPHVLVIDDGSTDADLATLLKPLDVHLLRHPVNRGKGAALQSAFTYARHHGADYLITLDADGQHSPEDIPIFLPHLAPSTLLLGHRLHLTGHRPASSTFGQSFSDFWITLETGITPTDSQSGFRVYPLHTITQLPFRTTRYNFEVELLTRALWAGLATKSLPIRVFYPDPKDRISHFHPIKDNLRLTLLHTRLIARQLLPIPHRRLVPRLPFVSHELRTLRAITKNSSPLGLAAAVFLSLLLTLAHSPPSDHGPIMYSLLILIYLILRLHLNTLATILPAGLAAIFLLNYPNLPTQLAHALFGPNVRHAYFIGAHLIAFPVATIAACLTYALARKARAGKAGL